AGQMRGRQQVSLAENAGDGGMGALAGRAAGAIGHRNEAGIERLQAADGLPKTLLHVSGLRRKEFEGNRRLRRVGSGGQSIGHGVSSFHGSREGWLGSVSG